MIQDIKVLSARRAYEFRADDLRLTILTTKPVQDAIQQVFNFQLAQVGTPVPTFGSVPGTIPPGIAFNFGLWAQQGGASLPIRFLHIEQRRLVIDVAGPSSAIDSIYERLRLVVQEITQALNLATDTAAIGEPERIRDFSEITAKCSWPLEAVFVPAVRGLFAEAAGMGESAQDTVFMPTVYAQPHAVGQESLGAIGIGPFESTTFQFAPRAGTLPEERVHFSGALLTTEAHIEYLRQVDAALSGK
jgi:hypothetical protein